MVKLFTFKVNTCAQWDFKFCEWFLGLKVGKRIRVGEEYKFCGKTEFS